MKKILETGIMIAATLGFFGIIYPELCLIEDTCKIVEEEETEAGLYDTGDESGIEGQNGANGRTDSPDRAEIYEPDSSGKQYSLKSQNNSYIGNMDIFRNMSDLPPGRIRIKSKLIECLTE